MGQGLPTPVLEGYVPVFSQASAEDPDINIDPDINTDPEKGPQWHLP